MLDLLLLMNLTPTMVEEEIEIVTWNDIEGIVRSTLLSLKEEDVMLLAIHLWAAST